MRRAASVAGALALLAAPALAQGEEQAAVEGCIDAVQAQVGGGGQVLASEFSEAGTLVYLEDSTATIWRCIGYRDGSVGELAVAEDLSELDALMSGGVEPVVVQFAPGTSGATYGGTLEAGGAVQYVLGAREGQVLYVTVTSLGQAGMYYHIRNPDGSQLLDGMDWATPYQGQLWQSGDHVVEIVNTASAPAQYEVVFGIE
ncbi:hypothetical protein HKCCE2091_14025 [Rhodobacterales bacterium HKCCE2091]|nr:hypothetical protein [Rhodobacterales bacterium HKCCE2091]